MGKSQPQLPIHNQHQHNLQGSSLPARCSIGFSRFCELFTFKCVFILLLSLAVFLTAIFSIVHLHHRQSGFDAKASVKNSATVQAYFRLNKPVSALLPQISRLEYDINTEIGVPYTQVVVLSMHKAGVGASNWTNVVFGILSDPLNSHINTVSLSVLKSSLIELFNQRTNLTLTTSIFGQPSSFETLKFPGGITIIPQQSASIWMIPEALFNFTLPNSIREIEENFIELKEQLKSGLQLKSYEKLYVEVTNKVGSTRDPPVTVQASIVSNLGNLVPLRLKQLAQTITGSSPSRNLGLDHSVFGKVKEISLSSYLTHTLNAPTPAPSPAPSPELNDHAGPTISPSPAFSPSPHSLHVPPSPGPGNGPDQSVPPLMSAPAPSLDPSCGGSNASPGPSPTSNPGPSPHSSAPGPSSSPTPVYQRSEMTPGLPPLPAVSYGSRSGQVKGDENVSTSPPVSVSPSPSSSATSSRNHITWALLVLTLMTVLVY